MAGTLNNLAVLFARLGDSKTQLSLSEESLAIAEKLSGAESPLAVTCLGNLGSAYKQQGQYSKALSCYSRSLAITEKIYGREHPNVAVLLRTIAASYAHMKDFPKAEEFCQRSLSLSVKLVGETHFQVMAIMDDLATLLYWSGKTADGFATLVRAAQLQRAYLTSQLIQLTGKDSSLLMDLLFDRMDRLHSACADAAQRNLAVAKTLGAEQLRQLSITLTTKKFGYCSGKRNWAACCLRLFEIASVPVRFNHVARFIINGNNGSCERL